MMGKKPHNGSANRGPFAPLPSRMQPPNLTRFTPIGNGDGLVMSETFDPYHRWLGIPPEQQPPHHYRLLGITPFESDREVIDSVAMRHMGFLQEITDGPYVKHAQQLLNELAAARRCLLDPDKKAAYDAQLQLSESLPVPPPIASLSDPSQRPTAREPDAVGLVPSETPEKPSVAKVPVPILSPPRRSPASQPQRRPSARGRRGGTWLGGIRSACSRYRTQITASVIGLLVLILAVAWFAGRPAQRETPESRPISQAAPAVPPESTSSAEGDAGGAEPSAFPQAAGNVDPPTHGANDPLSTDTALPATGLPTAALDELPLAAIVGEAPLSPPLQLDGLLLWLDAADRSTLGLDSTSRVSTWSDKSDRRFEAKADNVASRPTCVEEALGGYSVVQFAEPAILSVAQTTEPLNLGSHYTILYVARGNEGSFLSKGSGDSPGSFAWMRGVAGLQIGGASFAVPGDTGREARVRVVQADQDQIRWFIDGHAHRPAMQTDFEVQTRNVVRLGAVLKRPGDTQQFFHGQLAELLVYNRALEDDERRALEQYLSEKWLHGSDVPEPLTAELAESIAADEPVDDMIVPGTEAGLVQAELEAAGPEMAAEDETSVREADRDQQDSLATAAVDPSPATVPGSGTVTAQEAADERFVLFVNLGGDAYEDQEGNPWQKSDKHGAQDFGHEGGMSAGKTIQPFPHLLWAETAIRGLTAFRAAVPEGVYEVTLCFCDQWTYDVSRRRFHTFWERGNPHAFRRDFQGPGIGGPWTHVERKVLVRDGQLDIEFSPLAEGSFSILSGIVIRQVSEVPATGRRR